MEKVRLRKDHGELKMRQVNRCANREAGHRFDAKRARVVEQFWQEV
jgi:hypothetical protein